MIQEEAAEVPRTSSIDRKRTHHKKHLTLYTFVSLTLGSGASYNHSTKGLLFMTAELYGHIHRPWMNFEQLGARDDAGILVWGRRSFHISEHRFCDVYDACTFQSSATSQIYGCARWLLVSEEDRASRIQLQRLFSSRLWTAFEKWCEQTKKTIP